MHFAINVLLLPFLPILVVDAASLVITYASVGNVVGSYSFMDSIGLDVKDLTTGNKTSCGVNFPPGTAPANWIACNPPTFSFKIDQYKQLNSFAIEIKHQYMRTGKRCRSATSGDCTTVRAYAAFNGSTPGCSGEGCGASGNCGVAWENKYNTTVFSDCTGCGIVSGAN